MKGLLLLIFILIVGPIPILIGIGYAIEDPTFAVTVGGTFVVLIALSIRRAIKRRRDMKRYATVQRNITDEVGEVYRGK